MHNALRSGSSVLFLEKKNTNWINWHIQDGTPLRLTSRRSYTKILKSLLFILHSALWQQLEVQAIHKGQGYLITN